MSTVLERRLAKWPDPQTRAQAAALYAQGMELRAVLQGYPNEVISVSGGKTLGAARRAIYAYYALLQEITGESDTDPDDRLAVEQLIREQGLAIAMCRTGSALSKYKADFPEIDRFPDLAWWASQTPSSWPR
ncbi:hypothetical protein [Mycobacterium sp. MUNTM1]